MRPSPKRHVLAILRLKLGLLQKELAEIAGCSRELIQAVELLRAPLSEALALRIAHESTIAVEWLMQNDLSVPPVTGKGEPFTKEIFEARQAHNLTPYIIGNDKDLNGFTALQILNIYPDLRAILKKSAKRSRGFHEMVYYKIYLLLSSVAQALDHEMEIDKKRMDVKLSVLGAKIAERDSNYCKLYDEEA